jgi:hypothetical protein
MRTTVVLVHGAIAAAYPPSDPLALDPLSPVDSGARSIGAGGSDSEEHTRKAMT